MGMKNVNAIMHDLKFRSLVCRVHAQNQGPVYIKKPYITHGRKPSR